MQPAASHINVNRISSVGAERKLTAYLNALLGLN